MSSLGKKRVDVLNKKVPENPKYVHVKSKIDTGYSVRKHIEKLKEHPRMHLRHNEIFRRIKLRTLVTLMVQVAKESGAQKAGDVLPGEVCTRSRSDTGLSHGSTKDPPQSRRCISDQHQQSVINGIGELDSKPTSESDATAVPAESPERHVRPYLLLDVAEPDDYRQCHIITAKNYPSTMLSRSLRYETSDMPAYKNAPGRLVVVYDKDETVAPRVASTLVQRGYDNLYLLSGGLKLAAKKFPHGLITGTYGASSSHKPTSGVPSARPLASTLPTPSVSDRRPKTTGSLAGGLATKESFGPEDLEFLRLQLDEIYVTPASTGKRSMKTERSLYSVSTTVSYNDRRSSAASVKRQPWK